jgi:hypothetical protein
VKERDHLKYIGEYGGIIVMDDKDTDLEDSYIGIQTDYFDFNTGGLKLLTI